MYINIDNIQMPEEMSKINFNKGAGIYEISCSLFSLCNLNCKFCFQNHEDDINIQKIMDLPIKIIEVIKPDIIDYEINKKFYIRLYGGELLSDNISDEVFDIYYNFCQKLKLQLNNNFPNRKIEIYFGSNGMFQNRNRVYNLLKSTDSFLALSYDATNRFYNNNQKDIWLETLKYFHKEKLLSSVSIMLIKPSIIEYMKGDNYFQQIPFDVSIDVNQYIPNLNYKTYQMNDDDIYNFYKWCIDNEKFNVEPISSLIDNYLYRIPQRHCYCKFSNFFDINGNHTKNCVVKYSQFPSSDFYGKYNNQVTEENCTEVKNSLGLSKRGCLYCEHYEYCPTMCWTSIIFKDFLTFNCPYKRIYQCLEENSKIVDRYIFFNWRKDIHERN